MANQQASYEAGMRISYDSASREVTVAFRGRIAVITGTYRSEDEAVQAGERHCRQLGWRPETKSNSTVSMMRPR